MSQLNVGKLPQHFHEKIKDFLVESSSNIISAAFKFLCDGDLTEWEAKEYASKNILLNLNSILKATFKGISSIDEVGIKLV